MKKKVVFIAAMFLMLFGLAFSPAGKVQAKSKNLGNLTGKYFVVRRKSNKIKLGKGKVTIDGYMCGYGKYKSLGKVKKTFKTTKNVRYRYGMEVNELIENHKTSKNGFIKRMNKKDYCDIVFTFKKGKIAKMKVVYD